MDLFGRRANEQLKYVKRKFIRSKEINGYYKAKIESLEAIIRLKDEHNAVLRDDIQRLKAIINAPAPARSDLPLYLSETQEDIIHAREAQALSIAEAEDMLRELDFENAEIILDEPETNLTLY